MIPLDDSTVSLQLDPGHRHLEPEMLDWAEVEISTPNGAGRQVRLMVHENDPARQELVASRGHETTSASQMIRRLDLQDTIPVEPNIAAGYTIRTTNPEDPDDCRRVADLLNEAFGRTSHTAAEYQWFTRQAPSFRQYLDLAAVAPDGTFAAYVGIPYDGVNRRGIFEPVCTGPAHRRLGLGKALMREGLRRLDSLGAVDVVVETGAAVTANALYDSLGFTDTVRGWFWRKIL